MNFKLIRQFFNYFIMVSSLIAAPVTAMSLSEFETPEYQANWGLGAINASTAYAQGWTGKGVLIGIIDGGYDASHIDLTAQILVDGSDGFVDSHGTHVAGIAAAAKNDIGMHGVAYDARLALFNFDFFNLQVSADAFRDLASLSPAAINNSWGYDLNINDILNDPDYISGAHDAYDVLSNRLPGTKQEWKDLVDAMRLAQQDSVIVFAPSNWSGLGDIDVSAGMPLLFPDLNAWLAVVNVNQDLELTGLHCGSAANFCLAAPGTKIYSSVPGDAFEDQYEWMGMMFDWTGTSFSTPHVSGAVGIAAQMYPEASPNELTGLVLMTATDLGEPGIDEIYGWGMLNLGNIAQTSSSSGRAIFPNARAARKETALFASSLFETHLKSLRLNDPHQARSFYADTLEVSPLLAMNNAGTEAGISSSIPTSRIGAVWSKAFRGTSRVPSGSVTPGSTSTAVGGVLGIDIQAGDSLLLGLGGGTSRTKTSMNDSGQATADGLHGFLYFSIRHQSWFVDLVAGINRFDQDHVRENIPGLDGTVTGSQNPTARSSMVERAQTLTLRPGYTFSTPNWIIEPYISGVVIYQRSSGAKETGVPLLGYDLKKTSTTQYQYGGGTTLARQFKLQALNMTAGLDLAYLRLTGNRSATMKTELLGSPYSAEIANNDKDAFRLGGLLALDSQGGRFSATVSGYNEFGRSPSRLLEVGLSLRF